ncbi:MAG: hypothetical protein AVDCRST_MAG08-167 [uncultured Acetobacteraceae bacterium]|uniref:Uncharacterized protein n=1 Tax=uncultured Acetobacteraceae bacterium TaxID=169975 RepID=A0A6J4H1Z5_9PROT|nr:MAG: hypothetical protein AVDCRST_MAG08-167 [uncultured Acetobacteraceae bacterium]
MAPNHADHTGAGSGAAVRMTCADFGSVLGRPVEVVLADSQLRADTAPAALPPGSESPSRSWKRTNLRPHVHAVPGSFPPIPVAPSRARHRHDPPCVCPEGRPAEMGGRRL